MNIQLQRDIFYTFRTFRSIARVCINRVLQHECRLNEYMDEERSDEYMDDTNNTSTWMRNEVTSTWTMDNSIHEQSECYTCKQYECNEYVRSALARSNTT
jgi:HD-like signal output (HDOD) protein